MGIFDNFDVSIFHKHLKTMKHCFGGSSSTFHIINMSNWGHALLSGVGMLFPKEVSARITVHQDIKSLYKVIPKSYLPKNYGGEDISIEEYIEIWNDIVKEEESFLKSLQYKIPNESLRIEQHQENPDGYGVDGTFKKLNID
ncbi:hypothetical protein HHI36_022123 [Cryptolaemus montrouzieri]|uniref:CRAL-TRIO domain-containing protein n=1 Tax=Cryptolaemus montrouzieri TaxID=559131 RepID=A0ABD2MZ12_9CUCU